MVVVADTYQSSLRIERTIEIAAPLQISFDALLDQLGPSSEMPDGTPMPMTLEAWPGGRWFRDLGKNDQGKSAGHLWGHVQVIKPPALLEIYGPLFMSYPAISHVQYRLAESGDSTMLQFLHRAIGELDPDHCEGVKSGWEHKLKMVQQEAERNT
ncbi:MAG: SRPBCC domain-containing protein [Pirellulales bacterium]|nr:SRPBCC domain-containing protein [Pirellulales bacterium]